MELEAWQVEEGGCAEAAAVWALAGAVQPTMQLQVDVLGELGTAEFTLVWLFA